MPVRRGSFGVFWPWLCPQRNQPHPTTTSGPVLSSLAMSLPN